MNNYRIKNIDTLIAKLREKGLEFIEDVQDSENGKFGWEMDPECNKVELWQPPKGR